jgi:gluconate 2-dehydrogenase gamma chain
VLYYIDRQLSGSLARFRGDYKTGIPALSRACREQTGHEFMGLSPAERKHFLKGIEAGHSDADRFFQLVVDHTMQGFYGRPIHGGNKEEVSWNMLDISDVMEGHKR